MTMGYEPTTLPATLYLTVKLSTTSMWLQRCDSNTRLPAYETGENDRFSTLRNFYYLKLATVAGIEPATGGFGVRYSTELSYTAKKMVAGEWI
jgi:hypothetical protein